MQNRLGLEVKEIVTIRKIPKTTSGKFQRYKLAEMIRNGEFILKEIAPKKNTNDKDNNDDNNNNSNQTNEGTIIVDATCTPADITYPQDLNLLNSAREKLEGYIDQLHNPSESKKPRTYRKIARNDFLNVSKARKKNSKKIRKAIRKQLNYIARDIGYVVNFIANGKKA